MSKGYETQCHGVTFKNALTLCRHYNISYSKFTRLIRGGMSAEEAVARIKKEQLIYCENGEEYVYDSATALCKALEIDYTRFIRARQTGLSVEQSVQTCKTQVELKKVRELAKQEGFNPACVSYELYQKNLKEGYSELESLKRATKEKPLYTYNGKKYKSLQAMSKELNLNYGKFRKMIASGTPLEKAVEKSRVENIRPHTQVIRVNGTEYQSLREYCRIHHISLGGLQYAIRSGKIELEKLTTPHG